jgi:helix-turn-helix protein
MEPIIARKTHRTLEIIHGNIYFAPEATEAYAALGVTGRSGYFASRSAAMGPASAELVIATFFNFNPGLVRHAMEGGERSERPKDAGGRVGVWDITTPAALLEARFAAAAAMLRRTLGDLATGPDVEEAASLARRAAEEACLHLSGKPLFAGHAALAWPDDPLLVLWHAQTLLREFRGDIHIAAMCAEGIDGCEALVCHAASMEIGRDVLQSTRSWSDDEWAAAVKSLRAKGHVNADGSFTEKGAKSRQWVEDQTDAGALVAYEPLGEDGCERLRFLCRPLSKAIVAAR